MGFTATAAAVALAVALAVLTGCAGRTLSVPATGQITVPTFAAPPADPADSPELGALVLRDTGGLRSTDASADASQLVPALAAVQAAVPGATEYERISVYDDGVYVSVRPPGPPGRVVSGPISEGVFRRGDAQPSSEAAFGLDGVDLSAPARLVAGIERRFPSLTVTSIDLRVGLSYGFGLVWYVEVDDARGPLATVFADLDGTIVAVDQR